MGTEALYFQKPLVILDHYKEDLLGYAKEKVAFHATNESELQHFLEEVLDENKLMDAGDIENYISGVAHKIDGLVSERLWKLISKA